MSILISDSFDRADNATTLGITDSANGGTAKTWVANIGTMGIIGNQAYAPGTPTGDTHAYVDASVADCTISTTLGNTSSYTNRLFFRISSTILYWMVDFNGSAFRIVKLNGTYTVVYTSGAIAPSTAPWTVSVTLNGSSITLTVTQQSNSTQLLTTTVTDTFNQTATKHGIGGNSNVGRINDFKIESFSNATTYTGSGTSTGTSAPTGYPIIRKPAAGTANGTSQASASPVLRKVASGTSSGKSDALVSIGSVTTHVSGTVNGTSSTSSSPVLRKQASGTSSGVSTLTVSIAVKKSVSGVSSGVSAATGQPKKRYIVSGISNGIAWTSTDFGGAPARRRKKSLTGLLK